MRVRRLLAVGFLLSLLLSIYGCGDFIPPGSAGPLKNTLVAYSPVASLTIEADFPPMQVNQQVVVEVAIYPTGGKMSIGDVRTLERATAVVTSATPVGTPGNTLVDGFGPHHSVIGTATLETSPSIFTTVPTGPQPKPLDKDKVVWNWFVTPLEAGEQIIGVDIEVQWTSTLTGKQSLPYTLGFPKFPVWVHAMPTPTPPPPPPNWGAIASVLGSLIGGIAAIVAAWIGTSHFSRWLRNRSHRARNRPPTKQNTNVYPPIRWKLVLNAPMKANNGDWEENDVPNGGSCKFSGGVYQLISSVKENIHIGRTGSTYDFTDLTFEVQIMIVKGDQGGMIFRSDTNVDNFYYFHIGQDGSGIFDVWENNKLSETLVDGTYAAINTGLNQPNLIAVVAQGNTFHLYVNKQLIATVTDTKSRRGHGFIALTADSVDNPTEVHYSNVKVRTPSSSMVEKSQPTRKKSRK